MRKNDIKPINKTGLLIFRAVADPRNSPKNAKYREINRFFREFAPENPAKWWLFSAKYQKPWQDELGSRCPKGGRAYSAKEGHCLGGNHGNQVSANHLAPSHWKELSGIRNKTHTLIPIQGWEEWLAKTSSITGHELQWSAKINKAKQSSAEICNHM